MLRRWLGRCCALFFVLGGAWFMQTGSALAATGTLLIGEVGWAGSSKSAADEWVELWNRSNQPLDLTGYKLVGAGGAHGIHFDGTAVIPPLSAFLISNYSASDTKSVLATDPYVVTSTVSLSNDKLRLELFDADGNLVDEVGDGESPPAGISSSYKASMIRLQDLTWKTADANIHFDAGIADFGSPGLCDGCEWTELAATTTTIAPTTTEIVVTSTEPVIPPPVELPTVTSTPEPPPPTTYILPPTSPPPDIRLARIFPAPSAGKEWVELDIPAGVAPEALKGWSLYDAAGKFMTLEDESSNKIEIPSSRLNNGGDAVELRRPDGSVAERMTYGKTPHDAFWEKNADATAWILNDPNSNDEYRITNNETIVQTSPPPPPIELPTLEATVATGDARSVLPSVDEVAPRKTRAAAGPVAKPKKTAVKKPVPADQIITFDMLTRIEPNIRVTITGVVATKPGVLNKNQFVLLSADGHGLLVYGTSYQPSPAFGSTVRVAGTLRLDDTGLSLRLATKDRWTSIETTTTPQPRPVDLINPTTEDGWSLVEVEATVREVKGSSALLDMGDATADLRAKPVTGYRLARLKAGDVIRVRALADLRGMDPIFVIRDATDVELIKHASLAPATQNDMHGLPSWTPFGAAGVTVAITQGIKRLKRLRDARRIQTLIAKAEAAS